MSLAGNELLLQVFGRVETRCLDDLLGWAAAGEQPRGDRAAWLLVSFGEPRFVPILERALAATKDAAARTRLIQQLGHLRVPEAKTALQKLANAEGTTPEDVKAIGELVAKLAPAAPRTVPDPSLAITDPAMRAIFFDNLALTNGRDVSSVDEVLWATAKPADIPRLQAIRESIFGRFSDEAIGDWDRVSELITWLRWQ
jgi:hypothetical protein